MSMVLYRHLGRSGIDCKLSVERNPDALAGWSFFLAGWSLLLAGWSREV